MSVRLPDEAISRNAAWAVFHTLYQDTKRTVPLPLTGYTVKAALNATEGVAASKIDDITVEIGTIDPDTEVFSLDPDGATIKLSLTRAQCAAITPDEAFADVLLGATGGDDPLRIAHFKAVIGNGETAWT